MVRVRRAFAVNPCRAERGFCISSGAQLHLLSIYFASGFNLFGIKAGSSWRGDSVSVPTLEFTDDVAERMQARFRAYASPAASFDDYAGLISSDPRYADALGRGDDVAGFARALQEAGYATDPDYARKLEELAGGEQMRAALAGLED